MTLGIAICWTNRGKRLDTLERTGCIPVYQHPRQVDIEGAKLMLVDTDGTVLLTCTLDGIDGPKRVRLPVGHFEDSGYELIARSSTIRTFRK